MIELVKPDWIAGSEKRFFDFISKLGGEKMAILSHLADLDGVASMKIANKVLNADLLKFVDYPDLNDNLIDELKKLKIKKIMITDLMIHDPNFPAKLEKFADVLIIDHHRFERDYNSEKTCFMNAQNLCATYLNYYLFSKVENIENLDWVVACACIADWTYKLNEKWIQAVYEKYGEKFTGTISGVKEGKFGKLVSTFNLSILYFRDKEGNPKKVYDSIGEGFEELGDMTKYGDEIQKEIDEVLNDFDKHKIEIRDGWFFEFKSKYPIKSAVATILSSKIVDKTLIVAQMKKDLYELSVRRQDKKIDTNLLIKKLILGFKDAEGGGHIPASGGTIQLKDVDEFKKRVKEMK